MLPVSVKMLLGKFCKAKDRGSTKWGTKCGKRLPKLTAVENEPSIRQREVDKMDCQAWDDKKP